MRTAPKVIKMWLCRAFDFVYGLKYEQNIKNATTLNNLLMNAYAHAKLAKHLATTLSESHNMLSVLVCMHTDTRL